jgi:hypothetical protein
MARQLASPPLAIAVHATRGAAFPGSEKALFSLLFKHDKIDYHV